MVNGEREVYHTWQKDRIPSYESHDEGTSKSVVSRKWLPESSMWQILPIQTLHIARLLPRQKRVRHDREIDQLACSHQTDEPAQDHSGIVGDLEEGEESDGKGDGDAVNGDAGGIALSENGGSFAFEGQTEKRARCAVDVGVSG